MIRSTTILISLLLAGSALAQTPPKAAPKASKTSEAATASASDSKKSLVVAVGLPDSGSYLILAESASHQSLAPPAQVNGPKAATELPVSAVKSGAILLSVLDAKSQLIARKSVKVSGAAASLDLKKEDFDRVATLPLRVMSGGKAVSAANVSLVGPDGESLGEEQLLPGMGGVAMFKSVPAGKNVVKVVYNDGQTATQEIEVDASAPPAARHAEVTVADAKATEAPKALPGATAEGAKAAASSPASEKSQPQESPTNSVIGYVIALGMMALIVYVGWTFLKSRPELVQKLLGRLPIPEDGEPEPLRKPEPPPVQVPPGMCEFCGQPKDPVTGACACALSPNGSANAFAPAFATVSTGASRPSVGPSLIGISGPAAGRTFPLGSSEMVMGRDASCDIPLSDDSMVSRKHVRLISTNGAYAVRDEGSSNGTYLNGARITEASLHDGDELAVGQTRFRFEE